MNSYIETSKKKNLLVVTLMLTVVFILINVSLYFLNQTFVSEKIEEENLAFTVLSTHLINENDLDVALEFMEHYSHTHEVELVFLTNDGTVLFETPGEKIIDHTYSIVTTKGTYNILIDNTGSVTLDWASNYFLYVNVILVLIYVFAVMVFVYGSKDASRKVTSDIDAMLLLIKEDQGGDHDYHFREFLEIYEQMKEYLAEIDLLKEQNKMNMKGLVHDIKTPLTLMQYYIDSQPSSTEKEKALTALQSVNLLVQDLMDEEYHKAKRELHVGKLLQETVNRYKGVFSSKDMTLSIEGDKDVTLWWNQRDFSRVMDNILSNAFYYSNPSSKVNIVVKKEEHLVIEVRNKGVLLEEEDLKKLFDKGYRKKETKGMHQNGQGLGLYSTKLLIELIGGRISLFTDQDMTVVQMIF